MVNKLMVPKFIDQICPSDILRDPEELEKYKRTRTAISSYNTATFYTLLFQLLEKGGISNPSKKDLKVFLEGGSKNHKSDSKLIDGDGEHRAEIKAAAFRNKHKCAKDQFKNYCLKLLNRLKEGDKLPSVNYAFFRYGHWSDYKLYPDLGKSGQEKNHGSLLERFCYETRDLTIVPLNLLIAFLSSIEFFKAASMNQTSSRFSRKSVDQFHLYGGRLSELHNGQVMKELLDGLKDEDFSYMTNPEWLELDSLRLRKYSLDDLPDNFYCRERGKRKRYEIKPFSITRFDMSKAAEKRWLKSFKEHYEEIATEWLGIEEPYSGSVVLPKF